MITAEDAGEDRWTGREELVKRDTWKPIRR